VTGADVAVGVAAGVITRLGLELRFPRVGHGPKTFDLSATPPEGAIMVNVRPHDPYSHHAAVGLAGDVGDGTDPNTPKQPTSPGHHPPPPVAQPDPPVTDSVERVGVPRDGLEEMLKPELVDLAGAMGLAKSGTKDELIDRIRADRGNSPK
jgi:hypothetical protein